MNNTPEDEGIGQEVLRLSKKKHAFHDEEEREGSAAAEDVTLQEAAEIFARSRQPDPDLKVFYEMDKPYDILSIIPQRMHKPLVDLRFFGRLIGSKRLRMLAELDMRSTRSINGAALDKYTQVRVARMERSAEHFMTSPGEGALK